MPIYENRKVGRIQTCCVWAGLAILLPLHVTTSPSHRAYTYRFSTSHRTATVLSAVNASLEDMRHRRAVWENRIPVKALATLLITILTIPLERGGVTLYPQGHTYVTPSWMRGSFTWADSRIRTRIIWLEAKGTTFIPYLRFITRCMRRELNPPSQGTYFTDTPY